MFFHADLFLNIFNDFFLIFFNNLKQKQQTRKNWHSLRFSSGVWFIAVVLTTLVRRHCRNVFLQITREFALD